MLKIERHQFITQQLANVGVARVTELAEVLNVNPGTIRRDLIELEDQGIARRVHGGAMPRGSALRPGPASDLAGRIGQAAAGFIPDRSVVFLGPGTLTSEVVPFLHRHEHLTVITNALNIAWSTAQQKRHTLHILGGQVHADGGIYGDAETLRHVRVEWVVLEARGLDAARGLTHDERDPADMARGLFNLTAQVMVLAAPQALEHAGALFIAPASALDILVTGREADNPPLWDLSELGVRIVLA